MKTTVQRRDPETRLGFPIWYHHHGGKMSIELFDQKNKVLIIGGNAAKIILQKASPMFPNMKGWFVDWLVIYFKPCHEKACGRSRFNKETLAAAFGLSESSGENSDWLIKRFGADSAEQGKYIRWENFLNIPCPGTGNDGDPNVSIYLNDEIRNAVRRLLA